MIPCLSSCPHHSRNRLSYFCTATMWIRPTRPSHTATSASTGALETKISKYWMVPRASLLRGKIQVHFFVSVSSSEGIFEAYCCNSLNSEQFDTQIRCSVTELNQTCAQPPRWPLNLDQKPPRIQHSCLPPSITMRDNKLLICTISSAYVTCQRKKSCTIFHVPVRNMGLLSTL